MSEREHRCIRCGIDVYELGAACNDCRLVDPKLLKKWRTP